MVILRSLKGEAERLDHDKFHKLVLKDCKRGREKGEGEGEGEGRKGEREREEVGQIAYRAAAILPINRTHHKAQHRNSKIA